MLGEKHSTQDTYFTIDFGKKVYKQLNKDMHAEARVLDDESNNDLINANGIWLNNSPCPRCAKMIMRAYTGSEHNYSHSKCLYTASRPVGRGGAGGAHAPPFQTEIYKQQ